MHKMYVPEHTSMAMDEDEAREVLDLFPATVDCKPRSERRYQTTKVRYADSIAVVREAVAAVIEDETANDRDHNSVHAQAAFVVLSVMQQLLTGPGTGKKGAATPEEMNHRFILLARHDWEDIKELLESFEKPAEAVRQKPTAEDDADAARRTSKAMYDGELSRAHGRAASQAGIVTPTRGVTNHEEIVSAADDDVSIDEQVAKIIDALPSEERDKIRRQLHREIDQEMLQKAVWGLVKGASTGHDAYAREDLMAFPRGGLAAIVRAILRGRTPTRVKGRYSGGAFTGLSKPDKEPKSDEEPTPDKPLTKLRPILPPSMFNRVAARYAMLAYEARIKKALGPYQAAVMVKKGAEQVVLLKQANEAMYEDAGALLTDAENGYGSVKRVPAAETLAKELPELLGYFISACGECPVMTYMEIDPDTHEVSYVLKFMGRGFVQGDPLAPVLFTLLQAKSRKMNNAVSDDSIQLDYIDDFTELARMGTVRNAPIMQGAAGAGEDSVDIVVGFGLLAGQICETPASSQVITECGFPTSAFDYSGHPLVVMMGNSIDRMKEWGGSLSFKKTVMQVNVQTKVTAGVAVEISKFFPAAFPRIIKVVSADTHFDDGAGGPRPTSHQGVNLLGSPEGSTEFVEEQWKEKRGTRRMRKSVLYALTLQEQVLLTRFCVMRKYDHLCRTDRHPEQTAHLRRRMDEEIIGDGENGRVLGTFVEGVLKIAPGRVGRGTVSQACKRLRMPTRRGGLGMTALEDVGKIANIAAWAGTTSEQSIVKGMAPIVWMQEDMGRDSPRSQMARDMQERVAAWSTDHAAEIAVHVKQDKALRLTPGARQRGSVPHNLKCVIEGGNTITQKAMANVMAIRVEKEWNERAEPAEKHLAKMRLGGDTSNPFSVVPTAQFLRMPDRFYRTALMDYLLMANPDAKGSPPCVCSSAATRTHFMTCDKVCKKSQAHYHFGKVVRCMAQATGANPRTGEARGAKGGAPRGEKTGADLRVDNLPVLGDGEKSTGIIDWCLPIAMCPTNWPGEDGKSGDVEAKAEADKITGNEYHADAARNGYEFYGVALSKDGGVFGDRFTELMRRMAAIRNGDVYEHDGRNEYGYREGMWSTKNVYEYWRKVLVVQMVIRREKYIDQAYARARAFWGSGQP